MKTIVVVLMLVFGTASIAAAECAWVLWMHGVNQNIAP